MVKMILAVPQGFNAEIFCNAATALVRDAAENEYERRQYDYNLGEVISDHKLVTFQDGKPYAEYEVDAEFVDFAHLDALRQLQSICPQVEVYFENSGKFQNRKQYEAQRNLA